jgi:hypothetical protein
MSKPIAGLAGILLAVSASIAGCASPSSSPDVTTSTSVPVGAIPTSPSYTDTGQLAAKLGAAGIACGSLQTPPNAGFTECVRSDHGLGSRKLNLMVFRDEKNRDASLSANLSNAYWATTVVVGANWLVSVQGDKAETIARTLGGIVLHGGKPVPDTALPPIPDTPAYKSAKDLAYAVSAVVDCQFSGPDADNPDGRYSCSGQDNADLCLELTIFATPGDRDDYLRYQIDAPRLETAVAAGAWTAEVCDPTKPNQVAAARKLANTLHAALVQGKS